MLRSAIVLGLLSIVGPFAIDMYLPAMPEIAADLGTNEAAVQATISAYFLAFGLAQLIYGPLADAVGRKLPILLGLAIFTLGTLGATFASSVSALIAWRAVQGLGGAAVMVVPRAIVRDMYTGHEATKLMGLMMLVFSVSPMLAPLAGSGMMAIADWRAIFGMLTVVAIACMAITLFLQPETLARELRQKVQPREMGRSALRLLSDPKFMGLTFIGGFGMASFFVYLSSASFVFTQQFGLTPVTFSLVFAVNALSFVGGSQGAAPLGARLGSARLIRIGTFGAAIATLALLGLHWAGLASLPVIVACLFIGNGFLGLVIPTVMVMALDDHGDIAGMASSLGGTLQMFAGGLMIVLTGPFFDGTAGPMIAAIALCGVLALVLAQLVLRRADVPATV